MRVFIKKAALFASIPIICLIIGYSALSYWHNRSNIFKLDSNITTLFAGDSHIRYGIDDSMIENSLNLAQDSESYYFSYFKLNKYFLLNPQITTVYLGFGYHNLTEYYDMFINGQFSLPVSSRYFFNLPIKEQINYIRLNPNRLISYAKTIIKNTLKSESGFNNGYENVSAIKENIEKRIQFQFYHNGKLCEYSSINLNYLNNLIELCKVNKVELILIRTPIHSYYKENIPDEYLRKHLYIINLYNPRVVDLSDLPLDDDCYMPEGDHLSKKGAKIISAEIAKYESLRNK